MTTVNWTAIREQALSDVPLSGLPPKLNLPALPTAVARFTEKSNDPKTSIKELASIVASDSALTLELSRYVNSCSVGVRCRVTDVRQAIMLLGIRESKRFLIATGARAAIQAKRSRLINQTLFWNTSLQKALFARELARLLAADGDLAFCGALLQDYLLPVLTNELFDDYLRFAEKRDEYPEDITEFELETFGWDHTLAGASLAHEWNLTDDLICCILFHHLGPRLLEHPDLAHSAVAAVAISSLLPDQLRQCRRGLDQLAQLQREHPEFDLPTLAQKVDDAYSELNVGVRNDYPLVRLFSPNPVDSGETASHAAETSGDA